MMRAGLAVGVVGLLVLAGCGGSGAGSGVATSAARTSAGHPTSPGSTRTASADLARLVSHAPATTRTALGDLRTLDPCSLVDLAAFPGTGDSAPTYGDPQSMDYCVVLVQTADGQQEVHISEVTTVPTAATAPQLVQGSTGGPTCQDQLVFTDRLAVLAGATPPEGAQATAATCVAADAAVSGALTAIAAGRVAHRTFPAHSWGPVDPCTVLTKATVARLLPALADAPAVSHPARHQCEFGSRGSTTTYAALVLGAAYQRFDGGPTSTTLTVHGHQVVLIPTQPTGRPTECTGYGPHIPFPSRSGMPAMEMAELHVSLPDGAVESASCRDVATLARAVFPHLP